MVHKEIPLKAHAHRADDIFTALRIAKEFDVDITLDHCTEGHLIVDELVKEGKGVLVGPTMGDKSKFELKNKSFETPKALNEAGLIMCIITDAPVCLCAPAWPSTPVWTSRRLGRRSPSTPPKSPALPTGWAAWK